jgi:hypothetical protein
MLEGRRGKMRDEAVKGGEDWLSSGLRHYVDCTAITSVTGQYIAPIFYVKDEAVYSVLMVIIVCQTADVIMLCRDMRRREHKVISDQ